MSTVFPAGMLGVSSTALHQKIKLHAMQCTNFLPQKGKHSSKNLFKCIW